MKIKWKLFVASVKMYSRQKEALIWNILLPLFMIFLFGFVNFGGAGRIVVGIVNEAGQAGQELIASLKNVPTLQLSEGTKELELRQLQMGERDMVLVIPSLYQPATQMVLPVFVNDGKPQETQVGALVLQGVFDEMAFKHNPAVQRLVVKPQPVKSRNLTYSDFLIPGVLSMAIMQGGIFGVAFGFVSLKKRGILRRLWVTPMNPNDFILAQVATRLIMLLLQVVIMVGFGVLFFDLHFMGSFLDMFLVGLLGGGVFLAMGFAIAGISKSEDEVAPLANVISLPMMILGGVFFSRSHLPGFIHVISDFFPLTYLADGMRSIAIDGASLPQVGTQIIGLSVWCLISCYLAVKLFRWE